MSQPTITDFETEIENLKQEFLSSLPALAMKMKECEKTKPPTSNAIKELTEEIQVVHPKAVKYFNKFERSLDEYDLPYFRLNRNTVNRKKEDAIVVADLIIGFWELIHSATEKYGAQAIFPSNESYGSIQRFIKEHRPDKTNELEKKFMAQNIPTTGFNKKGGKHTGWKIGSRKTTITQIVIGLCLLSVAGILIFLKVDMNGIQYLFSRAILSLGLTLVGTALLEGSLEVNWSLGSAITIKAIGWVGLLVMFYLVNPPSAPIP
jgi:hypothetical protein